MRELQGSGAAKRRHSWRIHRSLSGKPDGEMLIGIRGSPVGSARRRASAPPVRCRTLISFEFIAFQSPPTGRASSSGPVCHSPGSRVGLACVQEPSIHSQTARAPYFGRVTALPFPACKIPRGDESGYATASYRSVITQSLPNERSDTLLMSI